VHNAVPQCGQKHLYDVIVRVGLGFHLLENGHKPVQIALIERERKEEILQVIAHLVYALFDGRFLCLLRRVSRRLVFVPLVFSRVGTERRINDLFFAENRWRRLYIQRFHRAIGRRVQVETEPTVHFGVDQC